MVNLRPWSICDHGQYATMVNCSWSELTMVNSPWSFPTMVSWPLLICDHGQPIIWLLDCLYCSQDFDAYCIFIINFWRLFSLVYDFCLCSWVAICISCEQGIYYEGYLWLIYLWSICIIYLDYWLRLLNRTCILMVCMFVVFYFDVFLCPRQMYPLYCLFTVWPIWRSS